MHLNSSRGHKSKESSIPQTATIIVSSTIQAVHSHCTRVGFTLKLKPKQRHAYIHTYLSTSTGMVLTGYTTATVPLGPPVVPKARLSLGLSRRRSVDPQPWVGARDRPFSSRAAPAAPGHCSNIYRPRALCIMACIDAASACKTCSSPTLHNSSIAMLDDAPHCSIGRPDQSLRAPLHLLPGPCSSPLLASISSCIM